MRGRRRAATLAVALWLTVGCGGGGPAVILFHGTLQTGPPSVPGGCSRGRAVAPEDARCGSDDDCVLTNWEGHCGSCFCPFAYYAINRDVLAEKLDVDPGGPHRICQRELPERCQACGVCGPYDETRQPTRAVCRAGVCEPDIEPRRH